MSEYREKRTVVEDVPLGSRPVVKTQYDSVVRERPAMSGGAIAALVLAAIATAVVITMMVLNNQQRDSEDRLARERAAAAQQTAQSQQPQQPQQSQQPVIVTLPQSQAAPAPAPSQSTPADIAPTSASIEIDISSKLLNDSELRASIIDVKVAGGTASLSGHVATEELKKRAEMLAKTVKGVRNVTNEIVVES